MPLAWVCSKQTSTSRSTTEAESVSLVTTLLAEGFPILDLLETILNRKVTFRMKEDNTATIKVLQQGYSQKLRHVTRTHKLDIGIVKEAIDEDVAKLEHVTTDKQAADIFTKDLQPCKWPRALQLVGIADDEPNTIGEKGGGHAAAAKTGILSRPLRGPLHLILDPPSIAIP